MRGLVALFALTAPAFAHEPVRIGVGFGLAFLPAYICEDLKLVEKHGKDAHLELQASYQRFFGAGPLQEAIGAGAIDMAPFGTAPLLAAWEKAQGSPRQILAVSGITTLPPVLLTNRPEVRSLADFRTADRIAIPALPRRSFTSCKCSRRKSLANTTASAAKSSFCRIRDAVADLLGATGPVAGYFSSAPLRRSRLLTGAFTRC